MMKRRKVKRKVKVLVTLGLIVIILGVAVLLGVKMLNKKEKVKEPNVVDHDEPEPEPVKKVQIVDLDSDSRNIAIMFNNIYTVWGYQAGLQDAYLVYEMIVEGGYTRLMAIFKDKNIDRLGCVRSSRPYFLDYALENDAVYIHFGASNQALNDIKSLGVDNINFMNYSPGYWRDRSLGLATEHTAFTSSDRINKGITKYGYRTTTTQNTLLNYSVDEIDLSKMEGAIPANKIVIDYSASRSTSYIYDSVNKVYLRSQSTAKSTFEHVDAVTGKQYTAKNIITYKVPNKSIDSYGRQALTNLGGGSGYYISNGYAVPITWEKRTRASQTVYRYLNGEEITVNDGNTYIQIQPSTRTLSIE